MGKQLRLVGSVHHLACNNVDKYIDRMLNFHVKCEAVTTILEPCNEKLVLSSVSGGVLQEDPQGILCRGHSQGGIWQDIEEGPPSQVSIWLSPSMIPLRPYTCTITVDGPPWMCYPYMLYMTCLRVAPRLFIRPFVCLCPAFIIWCNGAIICETVIIFFITSFLRERAAEVARILLKARNKYVPIPFIYLFIDGKAGLI